MKLKSIVLSLGLSLTLGLPAVAADWAKTEQALEILSEVKDPYFRLDLAEALVEGLQQAPEQDLKAQLLLGRAHLSLAVIREELGANAINFYAYIADVVDPIRYQAYEYLTQVIQKSQDKSLKAQAHFYRAAYFEILDEVDSEAINKELKMACQLAYQPACQKLKSN